MHPEITYMPLEVLVLAVSDVDRAKEFYSRLGWRLDADRATGEFRLVQFTPPGSGCSIQAAHDALVQRGVEAGDVYHCAAGTACRFRDGDGAFERVGGPAPDHLSYGSFAAFSDPDASQAHGEHEKRIGQADANWPAWYASYMVAEQTGAELPV